MERGSNEEFWKSKQMESNAKKKKNTGIEEAG